MEDHTNVINENIQSNINVINDASRGNQTPSDSHSDVVPKDDDVKTSEAVTEELHAVVTEGNRTVETILRTIENTTSSSSNSTNLNTASAGCSRIVDMNSINATSNVRPYEQPSPLPTRSQIHLTTTDNRQQQQPETQKHIMISYNRATATTVCQRIYDRLRHEGYRVWFDRTNMTTGSILRGMGEAIDNAYVVLLCLNEGYEKSGYCIDEVKYAREKNVRVIPCMMEENFQARGVLGFIKSDLMHIEFFDDDRFDESFEQLVNQIDRIADEERIRSMPENNIDFSDHFKDALTHLILSSQHWSLRLRNLDEPELTTVLRTLIQEFSPDTLQSFRNDPFNGAGGGQIRETDNDRLIQRLLTNNEQLAAALQAEQENHARLEQRLLDQEERIGAVQRLLQREEQERPRRNDNEHLMSRFHIEELYRQGQERNDRIVEQLLRQTQRLTELVVNQHEQHAREREILLEQANGSSEASATVQQTIHVDSALVKNVIKATVLLCILIVLFINR